MADAHGSIGLAVAAQPSVIFPSAEMLNIKLGRGMINHVGQDPSPFNHGLTDVRVGPALVEQYTIEFQTSPYLGCAVIEPDYVAFADPILA
jgi:hypothetical protein